MAIKEFIIGPQNYFEEGYFSGDYTLPNVSKSFLECDIDNIRGGRVVTGLYYEDNFIDGTYYHDNSIRTTLTAEVMVVQEASVGLQGYYQEGYYQTGYYEQRGSQFVLTAELSRFGVVVEANSSLQSEFNQTTEIGKITDSQITLSAEFNQTAQASKLKETELFAFGDAAISAQVSRIADINIQMSVVFDISTDGRRFRDLSAVEDADFNFGIINQRSRAFNIETQAAFSISSQISRLRPAQSTQTFTASVSATISHIEGADIRLNNFASISCRIDDRVRNQSAQLQSAFTVSTQNRRVRFAQSTQFFTGFQTADPQRIRFSRATVSSQFTQTSAVQYFKGVGRPALSAAFTLSATGFEAQRDPAPVLIPTDRVLFHFDETSNYIESYGGTHSITGSQWGFNPSFNNETAKFGPHAIRNPVSPQRSIISNAPTGTTPITLDFWWRPYADFKQPTTNNAYKNIFRWWGNNGLNDVSAIQLEYKNPDSGADNLYLRLNGTEVILPPVVNRGATPGVGFDSYVSTQWHHVAVQRTANQLQLFFNGQLVSSVAHTPVNLYKEFSWGLAGSTVFQVIDELRIYDSAEYTGNFTPNSQPYNADEKFYIEKNGYALIEPRFNITANVLNVQFGTASMSAATNISANLRRIRTGTANFSGVFTRLIIASEVNRTTAALSASTQLSASGDRARLAQSTQSAQFTQTTQNRRVRFGSSTQTSQTGLQVEARVVGSGRINLNSQFVQTTNNARTRSLVPILDSIAIQMTAAVKNATGTITLESQANITVNAVKTTRTASTQSSTTAQSTVISKFTGYASTQTAQFTLGIVFDKIQVGRILAEADTALSANTANSKIVGFRSVLSSQTNLTASADRSRDNTVLTASLGTLSCQNDTIRFAVASLTTETEIVASPTFIVRIEAEFTAFNSVLTLGDIINIDPFLQIKIAAEHRGLFILKETRIITVESETRVNIIKE